MKVLVIGATGGTGMHVVGQAMERGHRVTVLVREAAPTSSLATADVLVGDVLDATAVGSALADVDAVVCCLGVRRGQKPGTVRSDGTRNLVTQMRLHAVDRLVSVSTVGVGSSAVTQTRTARWSWPLIVGRDRLGEADRAEREIRSSVGGLRWTVVRPPRLTDEPDQKRVEVGPDVLTGLRSTLSRRNLATVLLDQLDDDQFIGVAVTAVDGR